MDRRNPNRLVAGNKSPELLKTQGRGLFFLCDAEFFQLCSDIRAVGDRLGFVVNEKNFAVLADVKRPAIGKASFRKHAVSLGSFFGGIAEDGEIEFQGFRERFVALLTIHRVHAGGEISHVKLANVLAALTERLALGRSAAGERFGKPRDHDGLFALEVRQLVSFAIAALQ